MTPQQRQQRANIRNHYLTASVEQLRQARDSFGSSNDTWGIQCIDEMLAECEKHSVDNFGETPMIVR